MKNLRKLAKGQECTLRLHRDDGTPICNFNRNTVVLCHIRRGGVAGTGYKPPDLCGVYGCSNCHRFIDGHGEAKQCVENLDGDILNAVIRTLVIVSKELGLDR